MEYNYIKKGNSIDLLQELPEKSVDVIFADPPYNLQLKNNLFRPDQSFVEGVHDQWDKFSSFEEYDVFTKKWLKACRRVLKEHGTIWVIGSYHNIYRVGAIMQDMHYWFLNDVVWVKSNPMPNFKGRRFTNAHETLLWCAKSENSRYRFNYEAMKALNDDLQMRSDWHLSLCTGKERLKDNLGKKIHPTQKPESLLYRVLLASTKPEDIVLDPFSGTGTTCVMAKKMGRNYIGFEQSDFYVQHAQKRLEATKVPQHSLEIEVSLPKRKEPRVPFGHLVEQGYIAAGAKLTSLCSRYTAHVRADGSIKTKRFDGSIHRVGAMLQGASSCNGWTFWQINVHGRAMAIDEIRKQFRQEQNIA